MIGFERSTTDSTVALDARMLVRARTRWGMAKWSNGSSIGYVLDLGADRLTLEYTAHGCPTRETIVLCSTPCHFGGRRWWARCPGCDRRVAVLHFAAYGFRCRCCADLAYPSTRESPFSRAVRRTRKLRARIDASPAVGGPLAPKPARMWCRTFERICAEIEAADWAALGCMHGWLERFERRTGRLLERADAGR